MRLNVFDERRRLSHHRERKKIERNTRAKRERKHTKREREKRTKKEKKALSLLSLFLLFCFSLSLSCFFFGSACSLSKSFSLIRSVSRFPLSRNSDESARGFQRAPLCCSETRALQREKRERERERKRRERARARKRTLFTDGSFSPLLFLSAITARN